MCKNGAEIRGWHNSETLQFYIIWCVCLKVSDDKWPLCLALNCRLYVITSTACFPVVNIKTLHRNYRWSHILEKEKKKIIANMSDAESTQMNNLYLTGEMIMHVLIVHTVLGGHIRVAGSSTSSSGRSSSSSSNSNTVLFSYI